MTKRKPVPVSNETEVLVKSKRRCCLCFVLNGDDAEKKGQIAHLDRNPANSKLENLAWLCFDHHDQYDGKTSQSKGFTINEIKEYRRRLYKAMAERRESATSTSPTIIPDNPKRTSQEDLVRLNELLKMGEDLIKKRIPIRKSGSNPLTGVVFVSNADDLVDRQSAQQWGMLCLSTLSRLFGADSGYSRKFDEQFKNFPNYTPVISALGILKAAKVEYESNVREPLS